MTLKLRLYEARHLTAKKELTRHWLQTAAAKEETIQGRVCFF